MPTKSKVPPNKGPAPSIPKPTEPEQGGSSSNSNFEHTRTASGLSQEAEDQFEVELCWCIQQLQATLMDSKLQDKQVYNMTKSLNVLKSGNASLIRKRQVMRNTFGDYRAKMADDEKKFGKSISVVKFSPSNPKKPIGKPKFLRKACRAMNSDNNDGKKEGSSQETKKKALITPDTSHEPFRFNFTQDESL
ncbi:hypothetical protein QAD02_009115 [Eretmocerus hayati]|uniref:Uncharacterized protein n=1 Tax=Eretmocerus hayati TaxID=131215 RepID=A0ACC2NAT7_9HYME|nr:hypothetical protein QAD02_009115 [Eretmocerus hayati]